MPNKTLKCLVVVTDSITVMTGGKRVKHTNQKVSLPRAEVLPDCDSNPIYVWLNLEPHSISCLIKHLAMLTVWFLFSKHSCWISNTQSYCFNSDLLESVQASNAANFKQGESDLPNWHSGDSAGAERI